MSMSKYRVDMPWDMIFEFINKHNFNINPDFQRDYVWDTKNKTKYIEHILKSGPSGKEIYFNHPGWMKDFEGEGVLVDGKQRINAVLEFLNNMIPAFGYYFDEFEDKLPFTVATFSVHINDLKDKKDVLQWYLDLNSGVPHNRSDIKKVEEMLCLNCEL